jgi:hypothetical protein
MIYAKAHAKILLSYRVYSIDVACLLIFSLPKPRNPFSSCLQQQKQQFIANIFTILLRFWLRGDVYEIIKSSRVQLWLWWGRILWRISFCFPRGSEGNFHSFKEGWSFEEKQKEFGVFWETFGDSNAGRKQFTWIQKVRWRLKHQEDFPRATNASIHLRFQDLPA